MTRRTAFLLLLALLCLMALCAHAEEPAVYLDKASIQVVRGGYGWIRSQLLHLPVGVRITGMVWESTDESVVTINQEAKYMAVGRGRARLIRRIRTSDGMEYSAACDVHVVIPVEEIVPENAEMVMLSGSTADFPGIRILPEQADDRSCSWSCDQPDIVSIENGMLHAHSPGEARLTVTSNERITGRRIRSCTIRIQVIPAVQFAAFRGYDGPLRLQAGTSEQLRIAIHPSDTPLQILHFVSSEEQTVSVSPEGLVRALAPGRATVTVWTDQTRSGERLEDTIEVEVYQKIQKITLHPSPFVAFRGQTVTLAPDILPAGADTSTLVLDWTSQNPYVAELIPGGLSASVNCCQVGQSTISVSSREGGRQTASIRFRVEPDVPVSIRDAVPALDSRALHLTIRFKSRMRETWIREITVHYSFADSSGQVLAEAEVRSPFAIRPTRFVSYPVYFPLETIPDTAAFLRLRITGIAYDGGTYELPADRQSTYEFPLS